MVSSLSARGVSSVRVLVGWWGCVGGWVALGGWVAGKTETSWRVDGVSDADTRPTRALLSVFRR